MVRIKVAFIFFTVATSIYAFLGGGNLAYSIFYATLLVFLFGMLQILIQWKTMKIEIKVERDMYSIGDEINFHTIVNSFSLVPAAYIFISNTEIKNIKKNYGGDIIVLNPRNRKVILNQFKFNIRGIYDFSDTKVVFSDLFSIIEARKSFQGNNSIKVYPKVYIIDEKYFDIRNIYQSSNRNLAIIDNSTEVRDYRKYIPGDSLKRINWKLSAKHNELYVKNFSEVISKDLNIFLNMVNQEVMEEYPGIIEEQMIDFCASLINHLQNKNIKVNLFINNIEEEYFHIENKDELNFLMGYFLEHKSRGTSNLTALLNSKTKVFESGSWIGIITIRIDESLKNEIDTLLSEGFKISIFYCIEDNLEFSNETKRKGLDLIKCEKAIISEEE